MLAPPPKADPLRIPQQRSAKKEQMCSLAQARPARAQCSTPGQVELPISRGFILSAGYSPLVAPATAETVRLRDSFAAGSRATTRNLYRRPGSSPVISRESCRA